MKPTFSQLKGIWPNASDALISGILETWDAAVKIADLTTVKRLKRFFGQISEESRGGSVLTENLNYTTPARLVQVWPTRFNLASAALYIRRPQALANKVYNGRMGNRLNSNDGWDYRGRGLKMITGREMYEKYDLLENPDWASDPSYALVLAAKIWKDKRCNELADRDDDRGLTVRINGGTTNLASRIAWTEKWGRLFEGRAADGTVRYGDINDRVKLVQQRLKDLNYGIGRVDRHFGDETRRAVLDFQARNNLPTSGYIDRHAFDLLFSEEALPRTVGESRANASVSELREEGSHTIAIADQVKQAGLGLALFGGGSELGVLDKAKGLFDEASSVRAVISTGQELLTWGLSYWPITLIVIGFLIYRYGFLFQRLRLSSHRKGEDMSR